MTTSLILGSVPAVLVGSFLSSRAPDRYIRPAITFVILASGLKYVGVSTTALGWILCLVLFTAFVVWVVLTKPWLPSAIPVPLDAAHDLEAHDIEAHDIEELDPG